MAMFRSQPLSPTQAKVLVLLLLYTGLCATTAAAVAEAFQQEESNKQHEQRTATNNNPYASLFSTSGTVQSQDDYFYNRHGYDALLSSSNVVAAAAAATPPAPKCWRSAMHVLLWQDNDSSNRKNGPRQQDAVTLCQSLPDSHQKLLALEITRCHMADLGRDLFSTPTQRVNQDAAAAGEAAATTTTKEVNGGDGTRAGHDVEPIHCHEPLTNVDDMYLCLKYLTDSGTNAYTQYVAYVQLLCTRLTQEVFLAHQQDVQQEMSRRYQDVASQSVSQMETIQGLAKLQTDQFHALATRLPEQIREKLTFEIQERLSASVDEHLDEHLGTRLKAQLSNLSHIMLEQATNQALALQRAWEKVATRERQEYIQWARNQTAWWQQQHSTREIREQRDAMKRAWDERMNALLLGQTTGSSSSTTSTGIMSDGGKIMAGLDFVLTTLTRGFSWVAFLLYFVTTLNMIWLFTRPRICHGFRVHLFALLLLEAAVELMLMFLVEQHVLTEIKRVGHVQELRRWAMFLECATFVLGLVLSLFGSFTTPSAAAAAAPPTGPATILDAMASRESFRPVPGPSGANNGFMMGMNHEQQQQQQQPRLLYFNNTNTSARSSLLSQQQQPFGPPTAQVTPQQQSMYSPIAGSGGGGGHEMIFGRGGGGGGHHHGSTVYHHHSPTLFASSLHANHQQQQQLHHQQLHQQIPPPPPPPPHPFMYHHYYSPTALPLHGGAIHPTTTTTTTRNNNFHGTATNTNNNNANGAVLFASPHYDTSTRRSLRNATSSAAAASAAAAVAFSRFSVAHDPQEQQHEQQQQLSSSSWSSSPFVSLVHNHNNPQTMSVSAMHVAAPGSGSAMHDEDEEEEEDVFMDALCEFPKDNGGEEFQPAESAVTAAGAAAAAATPIPTTTTMSSVVAIMPTQDCLIHDNAMAKRTTLSRKRCRANHAERNQEDDEKSNAAAAEPSPPRKKPAKIGTSVRSSTTTTTTTTSQS